jgi:signal peptidase I
MYYHRSTTETITLVLDVRFTLDSTTASKPLDGDSIVYRTETDTVYSRDTVKIHKDYFKIRTYDLRFSEHEAEGSATVSENGLDSVSIDNIKAKDPVGGFNNLEAGLNANIRLQ